MKHRAKFVAAIALLALLVAPAMALSNCWMGQGGVPVGHCAMVAKRPVQSGTAIQAQTPTHDSSCGRMSSDQTEPLSQFQARNGAAGVGPAPVENPVPIAAVANKRSFDSPPLIFYTSSQEVLCTFLI